MPEEPKQPIEDLLEAHAQKRRAEGGDFTLHPATRTLLLGEAKRVHGPAESAPEKPVRSAWFLLWTRLAGAFGFVALLGLGVVVFQQFEPAPKMEMAAQPMVFQGTVSNLRIGGLFEVVPEPQSALSSPTIASTSPEAASAPQRSLTDSSEPAPELAMRTREARVDPPSAASAPKPAASPVPTAILPEGRAKAAVLNEPATSATEQLAGVAFRRVEVPDGLRRNLQSPALPPVLTSFRVSLLGNRLRIEETDGSIYLGDLSPSGGAFAVAGTNRTSGLSVRFSGRSESTNSLPTVLEGTVSLGDRQQWRMRAEAQR